MSTSTDPVPPTTAEVAPEQPKVDVVAPEATSTEGTAPAQSSAEADPKASAEAPASTTTNPPGVVPDPAAVAPFEKAAEEPQNTLTRKFTEAEWTALEAFRVGLPSLIIQPCEEVQSVC